MLGPGETSPTNGDTDGDQTSDLIEIAAGTDANNPNDNPGVRGDFVFLVPYEAEPTPTLDTLDFATDITKADVQINIDTTASMGEEITNLRSSLHDMITEIRTAVPNTGFGVNEYEDYPVGMFGGPNDRPFTLKQR